MIEGTLAVIVVVGVVFGIACAAGLYTRRECRGCGCETHWEWCDSCYRELGNGDA